MAKFQPPVVAELLLKCARRCCICWRFRGRNLETHHIIPEAQGGSGSPDNGIPVCFDCHAEIESKSNMGRQFSEEELRGHRDRWFALVADHPEKLMAAGALASEAGPLEALLAELKHNGVVAMASAEARLEITQFRRAMAVSAISILPADAERAVQEVYTTVATINYALERLLTLPSDSTRHHATRQKDEALSKLRIDLLPKAIAGLEAALGGKS